MENSIAKEFNFFSLLKFTLPTIVMMVFMSLYTIVDGIFVSNFVGTDALSAVNIAYPIINVFIGIAIMLATGGSAIIARKMGEGDIQSARKNFSLIVLVGASVIAFISFICLIFIEPLVYALGATDSLFDYVKDYLSILLFFAPISALQMLFQTFFVTAGKPALGLILTVAAGVANMIFDYIFIVPLGLGISGAALATATGYLIPALFGLIYFARKKGVLYFVRPKFNWKVIQESCLNGSSEMVTNVSAGIITFLFNLIMMKYLGEDGVAAITIVLYAQFLMIAMYLGFSFGVSPVISYNYGSKNEAQLKRIYKICLTFIGGSSLVIFAVAQLFASQIVATFSPVGTPVYDIGINGFRLFSFSFLFSGINIFASGMFTALSNGKISATISFMRTFIFILLGIIFLPQFLDVNGIWLAVPFAECLTVLLAGSYMWKMRHQYHYAGAFKKTEDLEG
ncbi:MAG: MATE family efflux transporter [Turicibacter sp.]